MDVDDDDDCFFIFFIFTFMFTHIKNKYFHWHDQYFSNDHCYKR